MGGIDGCADPWPPPEGVSASRHAASTPAMLTVMPVYPAYRRKSRLRMPSAAPAVKRFSTMSASPPVVSRAQVMARIMRQEAARGKGTPGAGGSIAYGALRLGHLV